MGTILVLMGLVGQVALDPEAAAASIRAWHEDQEGESLSRVQVSPVPGRPDLVLAICDYQDGWWGFFSLYHLTHGVVDWEAGGSVEEQSVHKLRARIIPGFTNPIVEVFGMTHMGNGNLYLYELRGGGLHLILETRAVDSHWGEGKTFKDGCLEPEYRDVNGDGAVDAVLQGAIEEWDGKGDIILRSWSCRKVCLWDSVRGSFVEEPTLEEGFSDPPPALRLPLLVAAGSLILASCVALLSSRRP
jgi:hypothetical protein